MKGREGGREEVSSVESRESFRARCRLTLVRKGKFRGWRAIRYDRMRRSGRVRVAEREKVAVGTLEGEEERKESSTSSPVLVRFATFGYGAHQIFGTNRARSG